MRLPRRLLARTAFAAVLALPTSVLVAPRVAVAEVPPRTSEYHFGYNVGAVPRQTLLKKVSAVWNVATATKRSSSRYDAESAWTFMSLGGGCVTSDCRVTDSTVYLLVGTEAVVEPSGAVTYRAVYQLAPLDIAVAPLAVSAGDRIRGTIDRVSGLAALWQLTLRNLTTGESWTTSTTHASLFGSAVWAVEGRVLVDEFGEGHSLMPTLSATQFDEITLNGAYPRLRPEEREVFVPAMTTEVLGTPSLPQPDGNGFGACAWATTCPVPPNF